MTWRYCSSPTGVCAAVKCTGEDVNMQVLWKEVLLYVKITRTLTNTYWGKTISLSHLQLQSYSKIYFEASHYNNA